MIWTNAKRFLEPTKFKVMMTAILAMLYMLVTLYQFILLSSAISSIQLAFDEVSRPAIGCIISDLCDINASSLRENLQTTAISVAAFENESIENHRMLDMVRTIIYPGSHEINIWTGPTLTYNYGSVLNFGWNRPLTLSQSSVHALIVMLLYHYGISCILALVGRLRFRRNRLLLSRI